MKNNLFKRNVTFYKTWISQLLALLGDSFYEVAIVWHVLEMTGSALLTGGIAIASLTGRVVGSALISSKIDKWETRKVMLATTGARFFLLVLVVAIMNDIKIPIVGFYALSLILSFLSSCYNIARRKSISEIVTPEDLVEANAFDSVSGSIIQIFSWALAGFVMQYLGTSFTFLLNAGLVAIAFVLIIKTKWVSIKNDSDRQAMASSFAEGFKVIKQARHDLPYIISMEVMFLFLAGFFWAALPLRINEIGDATTFGFQGAANGVGGLITAVYLSRRPNMNKLGKIYLGSLLVHVLGDFSAALASYMPVFMFSVFISGLGASFWNTARQTIFHTSVPTADVGKVFALFEMLTNLVLIVAWILGGYLADQFSARTTMIIVVALQLILVVASMYKQSIRKIMISNIKPAKGAS